jgi:hypothetical protein
MKKLPLASFAAIMLASIASPALAVDKLYSPYVEKGEMEFEYFGRNSFDSDNQKDGEQKHQLAVGYGVNDFWFTELYAGTKKAAGDNNRFDAWEWGNRFQLTGQGEYWLDVGAALDYEWTPQTNHSDKIETRLILAKDIGKTFHVLNVIAEKEVGSGHRALLEGKLLWSSRYRYSPLFQPGFEISNNFGELKRTGSYSEQKHYIGPAAYGKIPLAFTEQSDAVKYRVAYFFGASRAARDGQAVAQLEYEMHF